MRVRLLPCNDHLVFIEDGLIISTWNSLTNVFYFLLGMIGLYLTWKRTDMRNQNRHKTISYDFLCSNLCSDREIISLYVSILMIGVCSTIYHASLTLWSISFDFFAIKLFNLLIISILLPKRIQSHTDSVTHTADSKSKSKSVSKALFLLGFLILVILGGFMILLPKIGFLLYNIFVTCLMLVVIVLIYTLLKTFAQLSVQKTSNWKDGTIKKLRQAHYTQAHRWYLASIILFVVAFICYFIPRFACQHYKHIRALQFHAFWHILSASGLFSLVRCVSLIHDVFKQSPSASGAKCRRNGLVVGLGTGPGTPDPQAPER